MFVLSCFCFQVITIEGESSALKLQPIKSPISEVHEIASKRKLKVDFEVVSSTGPPHNRTFVTTVTVGEFSGSGEGPSKKVSKHLASSKVLEELRKLPPLPKSHAQSRLYKHGGYAKKSPKDLDPSLNPISLLGQLRQRRKETLPVYTLVGEEGVRNKEFTIQVQVDAHIARGAGANKKEAKKNAAEAMLQLLGIRSPKPSSGPENAEKTQVTRGFSVPSTSRTVSRLKLKWENLFASISKTFLHSCVNSFPKKIKSKIIQCLSETGR